jgi:hypothetical protein
VVVWAATVASRPMGGQGEVLGGWKVSVVGAVVMSWLQIANSRSKPSGAGEVQLALPYVAV